MKTILIKIFCLLIIALAINTFIYTNALAQTAGDPDYKCPYDTPAECLAWSLNQTGNKAGYGANADSATLNVTSAMISSKIGLIISYALAFLGVLFLVISIIAGLQWMTAGGNEEKVKAARSRLTSAAVGMIIVIMAYAITWFVVSKIESSIVSPQNQSTYPDGTPCAQVTEMNYQFQCLTAESCNSIPNSQQLYMYTCDAQQICCKSVAVPACIPAVCNASCAPETGQCISGQCVCSEPPM